MRTGEALAWSVVVSLSAALSWSAWTTPARLDPPGPPPALPRPASPQELDTVDDQLATLRLELASAHSALGRPPLTHELESMLPDGQPVLPSGLPDNPLRPAVAAVLERCPPAARMDDQADWLYCPESGELTAVGVGSVPYH